MYGTSNPFFGREVRSPILISKIFSYIYFIVNFTFMRIIPIQNDPWKTTPYLIWHSEGYISSTLKEFIKDFDSYHISITNI